MILAGIDFSINSASICVCDGNDYTWTHFGREKIKYFYLGNKNFNQLLSPKRERSDGYTEIERMKISDAQRLCNEIVVCLKKSGVQKIGFEGHAFNGKGNSLLELVSYQFLLRDKCIDGLKLSVDDLFFYSPTTIKAFAGSGKFKKKDLLYKFVEENATGLENNDVYKNIKNNLNSILKGEEVVKPVDDVIDSYWVVKKLETDV